MVSFALVPFLLTVQSEPGLGSVLELLSGCLLERQRAVSVVGKAGYMYLYMVTLQHRLPALNSLGIRENFEYL